MRTSYAVILGMLGGVLIGALGVHELHAQGKPRVYLVTEVKMTNPTAYNKVYTPLVKRTIKQYGGRYVARGRPIVIEGKASKDTLFAVIAWDSLDKIRAWYDSPEYKDARKTGDRYAKFRQFAVEGVAR